MRTPGSVRDDEEVAALQHATGTSSLHVDALALYAKGRYLWRARTCASLERALVARFELVRILVGLGRYDAALSHLDVLLTMEARATYTVVSAYVEALAGRPRRALSALRLETQEREWIRSSRYLLALLHLGLGDQSAALIHYRAALAACEPWTALLSIDGFLRPMREHDGFGVILEEFQDRRCAGVAS